MGTRSRRDTSTRHRDGFSLLELVLVVTIIALALGIVGPRLTRPKGPTELRLGARTAASLVRFARNAAVSRGLRHRLVYDRVESRFRVEVEEDPFESPDEYREDPLPRGLGDEIRSPEIDVRIEFPASGRSDEDFQPDTLIFLPDGSTRDAFIYLRDGKQRTCTVMVVGVTGACVVAEGEVTDVFQEGF